MGASKIALKVAKSIVDAVIVIALLIAGLYAGYALWDNYRVYAQMDDIQSDMLKFKPNMASNADDQSVAKSFEELCAINPDVCAWLTIDHTNIDYPVLQGSDNFSYINTDVYGDFTLAGSIFLDARCAQDFSDAYSLVYGHHVANGKMFGDLDKFLDKDFFDHNKTGTLITPQQTYELKIFAVLITGDADKVIFDPESNTDAERVAGYAAEKALYKDDAKLQSIRAQALTSQILSLSTCASDFTDARTVILAQMIPKNDRKGG